MSNALLSPIEWLSVSDFSRMIGVSRRMGAKALKRCHEGKTWRGVRLEVAVTRGAGGKGGKVYVVRVDSIPPALRRVSADGADLQSGSVDTPSLPAKSGALPPDGNAADGPQVNGTVLGPVTMPRPTTTGDPVMVSWKLSVVLQVLATEPGSGDRAALLRRLATEPSVDWRGRRRPLSERTVRSWVRRYEADGFAGLFQRVRRDTGQKRTIISKKLDRLLADAGLTEEDIEAFAEAANRRLAGLWKLPGATWPNVQAGLQAALFKRCRDAGVQEPDAAVMAACALPRHAIERLRRHRLVAVKNSDAARYASHYVPRVRRSREHLKPMEWVAGDVKHLDVLVTRPDGSTATPKMVAWEDLATNRLWCDIFLMPKGEMIRREHIIQSFHNMAIDPNWGIPDNIYADNGKEYGHVWAETTNTLSTLKKNSNNVKIWGADAQAGILRARPYNPQAKVIEGAFAALDKVLGSVPGFIGGNRMAKKTQNQGKEPIPYPETFEQFNEEFQSIYLEYYHNKRQPPHSHLKGKSPNERFAEFVAMGWRSTVLDRDVADLAFSEVLTRTVQPGGIIQVDNALFEADALLPMVGEKVIVRRPMVGDRAHLWLFDEDDEPLGVATPQPVYAFDDARGAGDQARRRKVLDGQVRALDRASDTVSDLEAKRAVRDLAPAVPTADVEATIYTNPEHRKAKALARQQAKPAAPAGPTKHELRLRMLG